MADIFVSYSSRDRARVGLLVDALSRSGLTVWWDRDLSGGVRFSRELEARLESADFVLVVWSEAAVESMWVIDEATVGRDRQNLIPIVIDDARPPIGFRQVQTIDFSSWSGEQSAAEMQRLLNAFDKGDAGPAGRFTAAGEAVSPVERRQGVSMIILPFRTLSADPADTVLAMAIHEDLTTQMARVKDFFVIARATSDLYADKEVTSARLARDLGVNYAVEGSVRRTGDNVRVSIQLFDTIDGAVIAAFQFDRPYKDLIDLQNTLIQEIHNHLGAEVNIAEARSILQRAETAPSAVDEYRCARAAIQKNGWNKKSVKDAVAHLERAIEIDSQYAPAIAQLALLKALAAASRLLSVTMEDAKPEIIALAQRAVDADPQSSEVLGYAGCALCDVGEIDRGVVHLEHAFELDPSNAQAHAAFGWGRIMQDRAREGVREMSAAIRISPNNPSLAFWLFGVATGLFQLGDIEAARDRLERALRFDPRFVPSYFLLARIAAENGETAYAKDLTARGKKYEAIQMAEG